MTYPVERVQRFPVQAAKPAAGADWALTPTGLGGWRILSLTATLAASAAVANRFVALTADDQTMTYFRVPSGGAQTAGLTLHYSAFDGSSVFAPVGADQELDWPTGGLFLAQGNFLRSVTTGIDVADQWSNITAMVEELPTGRQFLFTPTGSYQVEQW